MAEASSTAFSFHESPSYDRTPVHLPSPGVQRLLCDTKCGSDNNDFLFLSLFHALRSYVEALKNAFPPLPSCHIKDFMQLVNQER
jgi:hypothetical protein